MTRRPHALALPLVAPLVAVAVVLFGWAPATARAMPVEDYATYKPQTWCAKEAKPGAVILGHWLVKTYGGGFGPIWRSCAGSSVSEHKEGRAFDWTLDAGRQADRDRARKFLTRAFATDADGNEHALARRAGIMYIIWNDRMYAAYDQFEAKPYLSSSCRSVKKCSKTLRHRNHMHISLSRQGGYAHTSWYAGRTG